MFDCGWIILSSLEKNFSIYVNLVWINSFIISLVFLKVMSTSTLSINTKHQYVDSLRCTNNHCVSPSVLKDTMYAKCLTPSNCFLALKVDLPFGNGISFLLLGLGSCFGFCSTSGLDDIDK